MFRAIMLFSMVLIFSFCGSDATNDTNQNGTDANATNVSASNPPAGSAPAKKHYEASHEAPYCKLWVVKFAVEVEDLNDYKGRWFDLKCDGTFVCGHWENQTNFGQWNIEEEKNIINLMFNTPENIPGRWEIQGSGGGGRILWKGNIYGNEKGYQLKLEPENTPPVKSTK